MKNSAALLQQLLSAARESGGPQGCDAPLGFATRVAARWVAQPPTYSLWARLSLVSLPCGAMAAALCLYFSSQTPTAPPQDDDSRLAQWMVQSELAP